MTVALFDTLVDLDAAAYRNIVDPRAHANPFADLAAGDAGLTAAADLAERAATEPILGPGGATAHDHAILYPFRHPPFRPSRYADGTFAGWYGSLAAETTLYETACHMLEAESAVSGLEEIVIRRRALYTVRCRALLVDLRGKRAECPFLTAKDHARTREIGRRLHREGHPGLAAPSARHAAGENLAVFTPAVLSQAALQARLTYAMDPQALTVTVKYDAGGTLRVIDGKAGWPAP
jgi:hypothetical protein